MIFYYDADKNVYPTQWDALASGKECWLYYYDDLFSKVDWSVEPLENLHDLYKVRAQEIRDSYDYVILCYSGGHDSTNVLETFYYNNIHIDEIVLVGAFSKDSYAGSDENHNAEIHLNCFPTLKNMNLPHTKITVADYAKFFDNPSNFSLIRNYGSDWVRHVGTTRSIGYLFWHDFKYFVGSKNEKKTCYIMGVEKLNYSKGTFRINDLTMYSYGGVYKTENYERVNFYTSPDKSAMDIMRKQAHIIRKANALNIHGLRKVDCFEKDWETAYETVIYNLKNHIVHESPKSTNGSFSVRDRFMSNGSPTDIHRLYKKGLELLKEITPLSSKPIYFTRPYYVEKDKHV
jgi:hypothetical protein